MPAKKLIYITLSTEDVIRNSIHWPILEKLEPDFEKIIVFCWGKKYTTENEKYHFISGNILTWLAALSRIKEVDLVYANDYFIGGYFGTIIKRRRKAPLFTRVGSPWVYEKKNLTTTIKRAVLNRTKKRVLQQSNSVVYNSHAIVEKNVHHNYQVIYNGIDLSQFKPMTEKINDGDARLRVLFVGNINVEKGLSYLLEAAQHLSEKVSLTVVGDGPLLKEYRKKYPTTMFKGRVSHGKIPEIINQHEIFILPTFVESFPNVLLEAMACAKPVIATKVYGIPEMIENNYNGILVPKKDSSAIVEALLNLIENPKKRKELGQKALATVRQRFEQKQQLAALYGVIKRTMVDEGELRR